MSGRKNKLPPEGYPQKGACPLFLCHCLGVVLMAVAAVVVMTPALAASPAVAVGAVLMIGAGILALALIRLSRICRAVGGKGCRTAD